MQQVKKSFSTPDETRPIKKGRVEILHLAPEVPVMRVTFEPGWKWSECVKPVAKTDSCQVPHLQYVVSGRIVIKMDDGSETEYGPGDLGYVPAGHDAWVVGNEPFVAIDYQGGSLYAKPAQYFLLRGQKSREDINTITDAQIEKLWELFIRESGIVNRLRVE